MGAPIHYSSDWIHQVVHHIADWIADSGVVVRKVEQMVGILSPQEHNHILVSVGAAGDVLHVDVYAQGKRQRLVVTPEEPTSLADLEEYVQEVLSKHRATVCPHEASYRVPRVPTRTDQTVDAARGSSPGTPIPPVGGTGGSDMPTMQPPKGPFTLKKISARVLDTLTAGRRGTPVEVEHYSRFLDGKIGKGCWYSGFKQLLSVGIVVHQGRDRPLVVHKIDQSLVTVVHGRQKVGGKGCTRSRTGNARRGRTVPPEGSPPATAAPVFAEDANAALMALSHGGNGGIPPLTQLGHFAEQMLHLKAFLAAGGDVERRPDGRLNIIVPAPAETT